MTDSKKRKPLTNNHLNSEFKLVWGEMKEG